MANVYPKTIYKETERERQKNRERENTVYCSGG